MGYQKISVPTDGDKITVNADLSLNVPNFPIIPFIEGDGIGADISPVMVKVVDAAVTAAYGNKRAISWMEVYCGEKATKVYGDDVWMPEETFEALREYVVSEAMHALGIPTTRALAAVSTGDPVFREQGALPGAVLTRVAKSHLRVGTFQVFAHRGELENLKTLQETIDRNKPSGAKGRYWKSLYVTSTMGPSVEVDIALLQDIEQEA